MDARTAVDLVGRGKARQVNMRFLAVTNHDVFEPPSIALGPMAPQ
jgi:hypothetical protein